MDPENKASDKAKARHKEEFGTNRSMTIENGRVVSPGQFEGERRYVPHFWNVFLDGFADRDDGRVLGFDIQPEDRVRFPELKLRRTVKLVQREDGFVVEV